MIDAGSGFPPHWRGDAGDISLATAQAMQGPTERHLLRRQEYFVYILEDILYHAYQRSAVVSSRPTLSHNDYSKLFQVNLPDISRFDNESLARSTRDLSQGFYTLASQISQLPPTLASQVVRLIFKFAGESITQDEINKILTEIKSNPPVLGSSDPDILTIDQPYDNPPQSNNPDEAQPSQEFVMSKPNLNPDQEYTWVAVLDENTCSDCRQLNGTSHLGSYWLDNDIYPGSNYTQCDGNCRCQLVPTKENEHINIFSDKFIASGNVLKQLYSTSGYREFLARFVTAGPVRGKGTFRPGISIDPVALESAVISGLFDNKAVFLDHSGLFDYPSLSNLAGVTTGSKYNSQINAVEGVIRLYNSPSGDLASTLMDEVINNPTSSPDIGLSMVCYPDWDDSNTNDKRIVKLNHVESVDLVFEPAAEGRILQALSAQGVYKMPDQILPVVDTPLDLPDPSPPSQAPNDNHNDDNRQQPEPSQDPVPVSPWLDAIQSATAESMIAASQLPDVSKKRLLSRSYNNPEEISKAIEDEKNYLSVLNEDKVISLGGVPPRGSQISGMLSSIDRVELAFDALMSGKRPDNGIPPLSGIRELYHLLSGDYDMTGHFNAERIQFANVNCSTMANLVANILNKRVINEFMQYPHWWDPIVISENYQSLQDIAWITLGGIGELPTVTEGAAYTELTWDDNKETASFVKKGGYLGITIEAIDKDDTGRVRAAPRALAQAAWLTLSKSISGIFTDNSGVGPTMADGDALFHTNHSNLGTTALSLTTWEAAKLAMRKQTELHSSERLGALVVPRYLLVPPDLETTAIQILASEYQYTYALSNGTSAPVNPNVVGDGLSDRINNARNMIIVVDLWTDTNNWAAAADPRLHPTIGLGFRYGNSPEIFSVASPTAGLMFTNDSLPVKVRFFYAVGPQDYRGLYKANVA